MSSEVVVRCTFPGLGLTVSRKEPKRKEKKYIMIQPFALVFYLYIEPII